MVWGVGWGAGVGCGVWNYQDTVLYRIGNPQISFIIFVDNLIRLLEKFQFHWRNKWFFYCIHVTSS